jgi:hypothetical protein
MHDLDALPHCGRVDGVDVVHLDGHLGLTGAEASWRRRVTCAVGFVGDTKVMTQSICIPTSNPSNPT